MTAPMPHTGTIPGTTRTHTKRQGEQTRRRHQASSHGAEATRIVPGSAFLEHVSQKKIQVFANT